MSAQDFLLSPENLPDYLVSEKLVGDVKRCTAQELGGGVSNTVLLIEWADSPEQRWVAKQSLGKLRVQDDWRSDRSRIFREADAILALRPILGASVPEVVHVDKKNFVLIMTAAPAGSIIWKDSLLAGRRSDAAVAHQAGLLLAQMINASSEDPVFQEMFSDQAIFDQLRIDPYYRTTAQRHEANPEIQKALQDLMEDSSKIRTSIVHGDYSPKNILVHGRDIHLIDFEVVHWGDPTFDAAFLLNHLFLKAFHLPQFAPIYLEAVREFWKAFLVGAGPENTGGMEFMTIRHLGGLMLARIDGKSPVEYIRDVETKEIVRDTAKSILVDPPSNMGQLMARISNEL